MTGARLNQSMRMNPAQTRLMVMLGVAYNEDIAVLVGAKTRWTGEDGTTKASRTVARGIVVMDYAYFSPDGNYLLLSDAGKVMLGIPLRSHVAA